MSSPILSPDIFNEFTDLRIEDYNRKYPNQRAKKYTHPMSPEWVIRNSKKGDAYYSREDHLRKRAEDKEEALPKFIDYPVNNNKLRRTKIHKKHDRTIGKLC